MPLLHILVVAVATEDNMHALFLLTLPALSSPASNNTVGGKITTDTTITDISELIS